MALLAMPSPLRPQRMALLAMPSPLRPMPTPLYLGWQRWKLGYWRLRNSWGPCQAEAARIGNVLPDAVLQKAFSGQLVIPEAVVAGEEGRGFESGEELLARVRSEREAERRARKSS